MQVAQDERGRFQLTLTAHELSVLLAGARMSLALMQADPDGTPPEAQAALERVLKDFDQRVSR